MPSVRYSRRGVVVKRGGTAASETQIRKLQRDLRQLGYLRNGIDGRFGSVTELAVKALQHDLLHNDARSIKNDGDAPVRVLDYNRGRILEVTGIVDQQLAGCILDMLGDALFPKLPKSDNPKEENGRIISVMRDMRSPNVPIPFIMAILQQESGLKHYHEPSKNDEDAYILLGLDTNASQRHIITSRGYGAGQYTLFHHPPKQEEVEDFMLDVGKNLQKVTRELREKFDHFLNGDTSGTKADDRIAEYGNGPLRLCKYPMGDPQQMRRCRQCMADAGQHDIKEGLTPLYKGSAYRLVPTQYYKTATYDSVPVRKNIGCDWPYAARRYNGAGMNSYHYQAKVLKNLTGAFIP